MVAQSDDASERKRAVADVFGRSADAYDHLGVDFFTPIGRDLVARARVRSGERVLDVGCGRGAVLFPAAEAVGESGAAVGIDLSARMVELTGADAAARGLRHVAVSQGDAEDPDFAAGSFDAVLAGFVVFFLPDPVAALDRYRRLLAPAGRLALTTFAGYDEVFDAAMRRLDEFIPGGVPRGDVQGPFGSVDGITDLLTSHGWAAPSITEQTYESRFTDPDHWLSWAWSTGTRTTLERVPQAQLDAATAAAKAEFEAARTPTGDYLLRTTVRFTIARPAR